MIRGCAGRVLGALACAAALLPAPARAQRTVLDSVEAPSGPGDAEVAAYEIGLLDDPELAGYVQRIGQKLLRAVPRRAQRFEFHVADQPEPNAFALPGGAIFVSRGLLALVNREDELACVLGHEIAHVTRRHAAAQRGMARGQFPLASPVLLAGQQAAYARDLERSADREGQILCAAAGYDPRALAAFLESLLRYERLQGEGTRGARYFDTHPLTGERATVAYIQASEIRWQRDPSLGDTRAELLARTDGLPVGQRPESGVFLDRDFVHPDLDFKLRFPSRWRTTNQGSVVGARAPEGDAVVFLSADAQAGDPEQVARSWTEQQPPRSVHVQSAGPIRVGEVQAWQLEIEAPPAAGRGVQATVTFVPHLRRVWRITASGLAGRNLQRARAAARSFRNLTPRDVARLQTDRLGVVVAEPGEDLAALTRRTGSAWSALETAVYNGRSDSDAELAGGEFVKVLVREPYAPAAAAPPE